MKILELGNIRLLRTALSRPSCEVRWMAGRSPITTFMQGAAKALLRARKAFLKADLHICSVGPGDAAPGFKVSEAQEADPAKLKIKAALHGKPDPKRTYGPACVEHRS